MCFNINNYGNKILNAVCSISKGKNGENKTLKEHISPFTAIVNHKNNFQNCAVTYAGDVSCTSQRSFVLVLTLVFIFYYISFQFTGL